jgi:hypothetical protein
MGSIGANFVFNIKDHKSVRSTVAALSLAHFAVAHVPLLDKPITIRYVRRGFNTYCLYFFTRLICFVHTTLAATQESKKSSVHATVSYFCCCIHSHKGFAWKPLATTLCSYETVIGMGHVTRLCQDLSGIFRVLADISGFAAHVTFSLA